MPQSSRPPKASMIVAQRIMRDVVSAGLTPGDLLPPERAMLELYDIGRGTLREALRLLEFQGVISLKPGPGGGPVLRNPAPAHLASTVMLLMQLNHAPYEAILEARTVIEPTISRLAASRIDGDALAELSRTITAMREELADRDAFLQANKRFHDVIAWSSGNVLFAYIVDSILEILDGTAMGIDYPLPRRAAILRAHEEIFESLSERDPRRAEERMREHIDAFGTYVHRKFPELLKERIEWGPVVV